ncbi:hypothetical protein Tco_1288391 [Tanacetum coccineum]
MTYLLQLRDLLLELVHKRASSILHLLILSTPTIVNYILHLLNPSGTTIVPTISTIPTISIVHVVSHLGDNLRKNGLQLLRDDSSNVRVLLVVIVVVVVVVVVRTAST